MKQLVFSFKEKFIKATLVEQRGHTYNLLNAGSAELAQGSIETGTIKNYDEVKAKLSELVGNTSEARSHHIFILLSEEASFLKVLGSTTEKNLLQKPEVQEDIPYSLKGSFTSLRLLKNKNIQLVAAERTVITTYQKLFKEIGLEINSIIPEPIVFLPFLEKSVKPALVISIEDASLLFTVIFDGGIYFSTTKYLIEASFDKNKIDKWIKELVDNEIKALTSTLDFEVLVFGQYEPEILEILKEGNFIASTLNLSIGKVGPQVDDVSSYKKMIIASGLSKQVPGFHLKDIHEPKKVRVVSSPSLTKLKWSIILAILAIITVLLGLIWTVPKVSQIFSLLPRQEDEFPTGTEIVPRTTTSASPSATPSAKDNKPKEATKAAEKKVAPKKVLSRSSLKIEVLNGNGERGAAVEAADFLNSKGYKVISTGNAANYNFTKTEIRLKKSKAEYLALLTKDLGTRYTVISGASLKESSSADAQIIIGAK